MVYAVRPIDTVKTFDTDAVISLMVKLKLLIANKTILETLRTQIKDLSESQEMISLYDSNVFIVIPKLKDYFESENDPIHLLGNSFVDKLRIVRDNAHFNHFNDYSERNKLEEGDFAKLALQPGTLLILNALTIEGINHQITDMFFRNWYEHSSIVFHMEEDLPDDVWEENVRSGRYELDEEILKLLIRNELKLKQCTEKRNYVAFAIQVIKKLHLAIQMEKNRPIRIATL